jgi:capsular exopolysaccharide synthesis family protein
MEQDQRLAHLPTAGELRTNGHEYSSYSSFYDEDIVEGKRTVRQYFNIVYKRLPLILALVVLSTAAAAFYMFKQPSQYVATTQMIIEPRKPKVTSKDVININFGNDANYYDTQLLLLKSPDLVRSVVIELGLYRDASVLGTENRGVGSLIGSIFSGSKAENKQTNALPVISNTDNPGQTNDEVVLTPEEEARVSALTSTLINGLTVDQVERTNLVDISVRTTEGKLSARVADKIAEVFRDQDAVRETQGAQQAAEDLNRSIEDLKGTIANQELELIDYMRTSGLPLQEKGQDLAASRLSSLSDTWLKAMETRRQLESRYNAALAANARGEGMNIPDLYENKIFQDTMRLNTERKAKLQDQIRDIEKQIQEADAEKKSLAVKYTDEHPQIKGLTARIEALIETKAKTEKEVSVIIDRDQKKIEREAVGGALVSLKSQLDSKRKEETQALAAYEREASLANVQGQATTKLTTLKREIETNRNLLDTYTQRLKEQQLAIESGRPDNIKIAANAVEPLAPSGPQRSRNILVAFLVSLAAGIGLAFLLDYLDDSVKTSEDVGRHLGLPTLALIPHHSIGERRKLLPAAGSDGGLASATALITLEERNSPMSEAYRHLRTSLLFSSAGRPPQSILVTSSQPSEGKTTTAINTAVTLAQSDADVVIIDCDLRRPRLHSHFGLENTIGLTNYLSGERNTENLIKSCAELPRLKVITSGPIPPNPAELLSSNEMKNLLQFLCGKYKHVIIDSPPAISFTDAAILSTQVDGVVLVAMAGKSSIHLMRRFKQRLGNIGARIYGVVLNGIKAGSMEYEYYGAGYYDYYKKSSADASTPMMEENGVVHTTQH